MSDETPLCPICDSATELVRSPREMSVGRRRVIVDDERMRCIECGEEFYLPGQLDATARRAAEQIRREEGLLFPDEIKVIRQRLGMTQAQFERLLGTGPKTVVRWERGTVCQSTTADRLMRLVDAAAFNVTYLRDLHGQPESGPPSVSHGTSFSGFNVSNTRALIYGAPDSTTVPATSDTSVFRPTPTITFEGGEWQGDDGEDEMLAANGALAA